MKTFILFLTMSHLSFEVVSKGRNGKLDGNFKAISFNISRITPVMFGAKGDGVVDDTEAINSALKFAKKNGKLVDGLHKKYKITSTIKVDSVILDDATINFASSLANITLTGYFPELRNCIINVGSYSAPSFYGQYAGAVNLHLSQGAKVTKVTVTALVRRISISCISKSNNTIIDELISKTAWGILFNDKIGVTDRTVDGISYINQSIGSGLTVINSVFHGSKQSGDAVEINVPNHGFSNILIHNNIILKTTSSKDVGLGIAFAGCNNVTASQNIISKCTSDAGAIHCELSENVKFIGNKISNSQVGASLTSSKNVSVINNYFDGCLKFGIKSASTGNIAMKGLNIISNTFINGKGYNDILAGNIEDLIIEKNHFMGMGDSSLVHLNFVQFGKLLKRGSNGVKILENDFTTSTKYISRVISASPDCSGWYAKGNNFGKNKNSACSFHTIVSRRGISYDSCSLSNTSK